MPLVVKFADTQKEKEQKKVAQQINLVGLSATSSVLPQTVPTIGAGSSNGLSQYLAVRFHLSQ